MNSRAHLGDSPAAIRGIILRRRIGANRGLELNQARFNKPRLNSCGMSLRGAVAETLMTGAEAGTRQPPFSMGQIPEAEIAGTQAREGDAIGTYELCFERLGGGDEPDAVFTQSLAGESLQVSGALVLA